MHLTSTPSPDRCPSEGARQAERGGAMLTFGSLFAGIGGIDLGLERAGMRCAWQVEIDDYAQKVLAKHWPNVPRYRDVRECGAHNLARVDVLAGGFPCQDISEAGTRAGLAGSRSGLWFEYLRLIGELQPRYVLVENVSALLTRGMGTVLGGLAEIGYDAEWQSLPAAAFGAPHYRERVFVVAYPDSSRPQTGVFQPRLLAPQATDAWGQAPTPGGGRSYDWREWGIRSGVLRVVNGLPHRVDRLRGLGNAVVPQVAEYVGRLIVAHSAALAVLGAAGG